MKKSILVILTIGLFALCAQATPGPAAPSFSLIPSNVSVSGQPGDTVGWGFTVTNNSSDESLFLNDSTFSPNDFLTSDGTYQDFIASQGLVISPGATLSELFDGVSQGVGSFQIPSDALDGETGTAMVNLDYSFQDAPVFSSGTVSAGASVYVPEPSSAMMLLGAAPLLIGTVRRKLWR